MAEVEPGTRGTSNNITTQQQSHNTEQVRDRKDLLKKRGSKSRLSKQDEVEEPDAEIGPDTSPSSEAGSEATIVASHQGYDNMEEPAYIHAYEQPTPYCGTDPSLLAPETVITEHHNGQTEYGSHLESQHSVDSTKDSPTQNKSKLVRCHALCDDASPPPDIDQNTALPQHSYSSTNTLQVSPTPQHRKLALGKLSKDSSIGSENGSASGLSRDSSFETANYTDSTGIDLEHFIEKTLNKNTKDRMMLLKLEQDMISFIKDEKHQFLKFPSMSSYHRMLVHRIAAFFGLDHNVDQSGKCVVVNRTPSTRLPDYRFREHIQDTLEEGDQPKKILKKTETGSLDEQGHGKFGDSRKSKSFEERKEVYEEVRKRIFDSQTGELQPELLMESPLKNKNGGKWGQPETRLWSSTESAYSSCYSSEGSGKGVNFTKASSFGGVSLLSRGNSSSSTQSSGSKMSKTDSQSSGFSEMRGGRPPTIRSSPPEEISESESNVSSPQIHESSGFTPFYNEQGQLSAVWVCTNLESIPPGSVLINPNTGHPYSNPDGSVFRWLPKAAAQQHASATAQQPTQQALPPNTLQVPSQQNTHVQQTEQKYQDTSGDIQQQVSQLTMTSPEHQHQQPVDNISGDSAPPPTGSVPTAGQNPQATAVVPGSYAINSPQPQQVGGTVAMASAGPAQPTYTQGQVQYFAPNQATNGPPVRYVYQVPYGTQPTSQHQDVQQNTQIQTQVAQGQPGGIPQQQVPPPPHQQTPQEGATNQQQQFVYSYPVSAGFQQMTVQSVDYGQSSNSQQHQYQGYATASQQQQSEVASGAGGSNQPQQQQGGGYSSQIQPQQQGSGSVIAATPLTPSSYSGSGAATVHQTGIPVQYYSPPNSNNSSNGSGGGPPGTPQVLTYQQSTVLTPGSNSSSAIQGSTTPNNSNSQHHHHHSGAAGHLRAKTPPTASHQVIVGQSSSYPPPQSGGAQTSYPPPPAPLGGAVISVGHLPSAVNSVVANSSQPQYHVSYATYPQIAAAPPPPQALPQQRVAVATATPLAAGAAPNHPHHHHHHHPQMISFTPVPTQGFTMVRGPPVAMRNTPPPQPTPQPQAAQLPHGATIQYPPQGGMPIINTNATTPIKVISMATPQMGKEQLDTAAGGMIVNEKGEPGANPYINSQIQNVIGQPLTQGASLLSNGMRVAGMAPPQGIPQIRPQNPAAFRTTSPVIHHVQGEVRLVGQQYTRPLYNTARPRIPTPTGQQGNHHHHHHRQSKSRKGWVKSSQDSVDSNPSSSTDSPEQTPQIASPLSSALLEVSGLPQSLKCGELSQFLCDLTEIGATIYVHSDDPVKQQTIDKHEMLATQFTVLVSFPSDSDAARALSEPRKSSNYVIMSVSRIYDPRSLCMI